MASLILKISKDMHEIYLRKIQDTVNRLHNIDPAHEDRDREENRAKILSNIGLLLKKTTWKNNIMREARELFYDKDFQAMHLFVCQPHKINIRILYISQ